MVPYSPKMPTVVFVCAMFLACFIIQVDAESQVQLVGGENDREGRVEISVNNRYGTICDDGWDIEEAMVICRQLGFDGAVSAPSGAAFGSGKGDILLDDVSCSGDETDIIDCIHRGIGSHNCQHHEDAGVVCTESETAENSSSPSIRLSGGSTPTEGRVEIQIGGIWGTVCDDHWDLLDATVACRQLGYGVAIAYAARAYFGRGDGEIFLDDVQCTGRELDLFSCGHRPIGVHDCGHSEDAGVICSPGIRLVGGSEAHEGRVELFHNGEWGTVCDDDWDIADAHVVCRQLGYGSAVEASTNAKFGPGDGAIFLDNVGCTGTEPMIVQCHHSGISNHDCRHYEDAGVVCQLRMRLVEGSVENEGRVELYYQGIWGTVCDDDWDIRDAQVVCSHLNLGNAVEATTRARFGPGTGPIYLDDVQCDGAELNILDCTHRGIGLSNCGHNEDAGVVCEGSETLRLVGGSSDAEGRVEIFHAGRWGTICDDDWDLNDAKVVCRQLGFISASSAIGNAYFGFGSGPILLDNVACTGYESSLAECSHTGFGNHNCAHNEDAGVVCAMSHPVRLVGGKSIREGRVEVQIDGVWGTICDDGFDDNEADVICRQLGFAWAEVGFELGGARFGEGTGPIYFDDLRCSGLEHFITDCPHQGIGEHNCHHNEDASVSCEVPVRLAASSSMSKGRVELLYEGRWGTVCSDEFDQNAATVVCRQLGMSSGSALTIGAFFGRNRPVYADDTVPIVLKQIRCDGSEYSLMDCVRGGAGVQPCDHRQDAFVVCRP